TKISFLFICINERRNLDTSRKKINFLLFLNLTSNLYTQTAKLTEEQIIKACKRGSPKAQKWIYDRYAPKMFGVCRRYVKSLEDAEDVLVEGFYKVLTKIEQYGGNGSFEGWIRRIMVNEALMFLRKNNPLKNAIELEHIDVEENTVSALEELKAQDILKLLNELPMGYRTVFNLYVIEGYKHREIAEQLGVSINTSKSQLILAKKRMRELLEKQNYLAS
ncbi:MAG: RNA polymerase sigma factor, partial [Bacteroidota bacterium]